MRIKGDDLVLAATPFVSAGVVASQGATAVGVVVTGLSVAMFAGAIYLFRNRRAQHR